MANDPELEALRDLVRRRRKAATDKIRRNRVLKGIEIANTAFDPRRNPTAIRKYNSAQLVNYLKKLDAFTGRNNSFIPGALGAPLPKIQVRNHIELVQRNNALGATRLNRVGDIDLPGKGMNIKQRDATLKRNDRLSAKGEVSNRPFGQIDFDPSNVTSADSLKKLSKDLERKLSPGYLSKSIKQSREELGQILTKIGNADYIKAFSKLTSHQFDTMWNFGGGQTLGSYYAVLEMQTSDRARAQFIETHDEEMKELIDWASNLPKTSRSNQSGISRREAPKFGKRSK